VGEAEDQPPAARHRLAGVDEQVQEHLLDLARVGRVGVGLNDVWSFCRSHIA
jgi:hypothetical protein